MVLRLSGAQGFYTVYEDLFVKLTRQEELAYDKREGQGRNKYDFVQPERFGARPLPLTEPQGTLKKRSLSLPFKNRSTPFGTWDVMPGP